MLHCIVISDSFLDWDSYILHELSLLVVDIIAFIRDILDLAVACLNADGLLRG